MPANGATLRVLLIEDNPDHAELIQRQLEIASDRTIHFKRCDLLAAGLDELGVAQYDVLLLDLGLPDSDLPDTVRRAVSAVPAIPIVVLTSLGDAELGVSAVQQGAQDYLVKTQINPDMLMRSLRYAIERKRTRLEVERYAAELERSNRDLERFARVVSHDLKSPLAVIQMDLSMLASKLERDPDAAREYLESAVEQARQMSDTVDGVLQLARVQQTAPRLEPVDSESVLNRALECLRREIDESAAEITHDQLPIVRGEETLFIQLFQNLLQNSIKYRRDLRPRIHVSAELYDHEWVYSVADDGVGIAPEDRERVFGMFERAQENSKAGAGIGLATCQRIVQHHGGRIWVDANEPHGTIFYFSIPLATPARRAHHALA